LPVGTQKTLVRHSTRWSKRSSLWTSMQHPNFVSL